MEDLTKHQIILLALFVSFVTSIATGIVAVSLMDQAPVGVTQTINRIVEHTIEKVVATSTSTPMTAAVLDTKESLANSVETVSKGIVHFKSRKINGEIVSLGMGIVLSHEGVIVTDKANTEGQDIVAVFADGKEFPIQIIQSQILGDIVFVAAIIPRDYPLHPVTYSSEEASLPLGKELFALGGKDSDILEQGLMNKARTKSEEDVETSISSERLVAGSPLFTSEGRIVGMKTSTLLSTHSFYSFGALNAIIPVISR